MRLCRRTLNHFQAVLHALLRRNRALEMRRILLEQSTHSLRSLNRLLAHRLAFAGINKTRTKSQEEYTLALAQRSVVFSDKGVSSSLGNRVRRSDRDAEAVDQLCVCHAARDGDDFLLFPSADEREEDVDCVCDADDVGAERGGEVLFEHCEVVVEKGFVSAVLIDESGVVDEDV
jgi:hypothetical protein